MTGQTIVVRRLAAPRETYTVYGARRVNKIYWRGRISTPAGVSIEMHFQDGVWEKDEVLTRLANLKRRSA